MSEMTRVPFITRVPITNKIYGYIYLTTCIVNEKQYIGQHKWNKHHIDYSYIGSGTNLKKDICLYGKDNFITQILDWGTTKDELNKLEIEYIQRYNAVDEPQFYNLSYGGENFFEGKHHSEVSKKLIREHSPNLGRKLTDAEKKRIGDFHRGKVYSEETRKKISMNNGMRGKE